MKQLHFTPRFYVAAVCTLLIVAFAMVGPYVFGGQHDAVVGGLYDKPSGAAWLGTDNFGHSVFTNLMFGTRTSLFVGLMAGTFATIVGSVIGLVAGYKGGWLENLLMGLTNVVIAIPAIVILILLSVALNSRSIFVMSVVIAVTSWTWVARAVAAQASSLRAREHLDVARLSGASTFSIVLIDVLPYILSYIAMAFVLQVSGAILAEAGLALIGLGPSNSVSLGIMLNWAIVGESVRTGAWWAFVPPTLLLTLVAFFLLMLQSSLDEVFNPRLRRGTARARPAAGAAITPTGATVAPTAQAEAGLEQPADLERQGVDR
jgi:peptide/nickel transport system permease protein